MSRPSTHGRSQLNHQELGVGTTQRMCLYSPTTPVQATTSDLKLADKHYWIDLHHSFAYASFFSQTKLAQQ